MRFRVEGPAQIVATDNGDATDHTTFSSADRKTFNGLALAILRATPEAKGEVTLVAEADGLPASRVRIPLR